MEEKNIGTLYIVATPIGNLEDITLRAINILKEVDLIAAEDTRHTLKLLNHLEISKPMISYHRHNEQVKCKELIEKLKEGKKIALVSDAGTPGICDPGQEVIKECIKEKINITPIPGACAMVNALIISGLDTSEFTFLGFLPLNKKNRKDKLEEIKKLKNTLEDLDLALNNRQIVLVREITKIHEECIRGTARQLIEKVEQIKGEIVLIIEANKIQEENKLNNLSLEEHFSFYERQGFSKKEIIKKIAKDRNVSKNEIYQHFVI